MVITIGVGLFPFDVNKCDTEADPIQTCFIFLHDNQPPD